jgi:hypothetical protein
MNIVNQMKRIKGRKLLRQMSATARKEYARLREALRKNQKPVSKKNSGLWAVSTDSDGTKIFKNKSAKLYGITPSEYADFKGFKTIKKSKKFQAKRRARA